LGVRPEEVLFVDNNLENVKRATGQGLMAIYFKGTRESQIEIKKFVEMP
jgi:FMN phosphatase YigB (HAD superfamily)